MSKACLKAMYVLQVGVQKIEQLAHHNEAWYGQILACWLVCKHAMEAEDARDWSFKMQKRLFKVSSRLPQTALHRLLLYSECFGRRHSSLRVSMCWRRRSLQLAKSDIGEEGYCWERTTVQEEESDRLCVFKACGTTMHVLPVGVQHSGQLAHEHGAWYGRIPACWMACTHLRQADEASGGDEGYRCRGIFLRAPKGVARDRFCGFDHENEVGYGRIPACWQDTGMIQVAGGRNCIWTHMRSILGFGGRQH